MWFKNHSFVDFIFQIMSGPKPLQMNVLTLVLIQWYTTTTTTIIILIPTNKQQNKKHKIPPKKHWFNIVVDKQTLFFVLRIPLDYILRGFNIWPL